MKKLVYKMINGFFGICNFILKYPMIIIFTIIVLAIAILVLMFNNKANVGGVLGKILGLLSTGSNQDSIEVANSIPEDRDVAIGQADERGYVQHKVEELETSINPFRDKNTIELPNGKKVKLPKGVKDTDIDRVIEMETEIVIIPKPENHKKLLDTQEKIKKARGTNRKARDLLAKLKAKQ